MYTVNDFSKLALHLIEGDTAVKALVSKNDLFLKLNSILVLSDQREANKHGFQKSISKISLLFQ